MIEAHDTVDFSALYTENREWMIRLATRMGLGWTEAEDVVHDVFVHAYRHIRQDLRPRGYLRRALTNHIYDRSRMLARRRPVECDDLTRFEDESDHVEGNAIDFDECVAIAVSTSTERAEQIEALMRKRFQEGKTNIEIARELGICREVVAKRLGDALRTIRQRLEREN